MNITPEAMRAVDLVEQMGTALAAARGALVWPDLTPLQRLAVVVVVLDRAGRPHSPEALATRVGLTPKDLTPLCAKGGPLATFRLESGAIAIEGSDQLYYRGV